MGTITLVGTGGIIEGNLGTSNVNVNLDAALELDGSADYLKNSVSDFRTGDTAGFITAWVKSDDWNRGTQQHIFSATDETTGNFYIRTFFNSDGKLYIKHMDSSVIYDLKSTNAVTDDGNWHHIAVGSTGTAIKMYIDGIEETVVVASGSNNGDWFGDVTDGELDHIVVGALHDNAGVRSMFDGYIADVRYYSDTLTDSEILKLSSKINASTPDIDNLQHWWKLNSTTIDSSNLGEDFGDATDLDLTPNSIVASNIHTDEYSVDVYDNSTTTDGTFTVTQGKVEGLALTKLDFSGDTQLVSCTSNTFYNSKTAFSVSAWIKPDAVNISFQTVVNARDSGNDGMALSVLNQTVRLRIGDGGSDDLVTGNVITSADRWYHLVATRDASNNTAIYVDGVLSTTGSTSKTISVSSGNFGIGGRPSATDADEFNGEIRDVGCWSYDLSAEQVASLYSNTYPQTPNHEYKLDEGSGTTVNDTGTETAANGTITGATYTNGTLDLDGTLTIAANGTLSAPRGNLDLAANIDNAGAFTHNNGTVRGLDSVYVNNSSSVAFTFYNWEQAGGQLRFYKDETIERQLQLDAGASHCYIFSSASQNVTLTMGTATNPESSYPKLINNMNTGDKQFWFYAGDGQTATLAGVLETHPIIVTNTNSSNFQWGYHANSNAQLKNCDFQFDITTEGNDDRIKLTGDCEFDAVTVGSGDILDLNGQRAEFSGLLTSEGDVDFDGSLVVLADLAAGGSANIDNETTADLIFTGAADDTSMAMRGTYKTVFINNGSNDYLTTNSTSDWSNCATTLICGSKLTTANVMGCTNLTIPTGGTLDAQDDTLTCAGDFTTSGGLIGKSGLDFDGTASKVDCGTDSSLSLTNNFTLEAWIKPDTVSGEKTIISRGVTDNASSQYTFKLNSQQLRLTKEGVGNFDSGTNVITTTGKWYHVAVTVSSSDGIKFYVDGKLVGVDTNTSNCNSSSGNLLLGSRWNASEFFDGVIDMARIFNDVRTESEIRSNMFSQLASSEGGLVAQYVFDEGTGGNGDTTADSSANSNTGTLGPAGNAPNFVGAGTFTHGTSTLVMSGTDKNLTFHSGGLTLRNWTVSGTVDFNSLGSQGSILMEDNLTVSGDLDSGSTSPFIRFGNDFVSNSGVLSLGGNVSGVYMFRFDHTSGTIDIPNTNTPRIKLNGSGGTCQATSTITVTSELEVNSGTTFNANGNTIAAVLVDVNSSGTLDLRNSNLNFSVSASGDQLRFDDDNSTLLTGNTTIIGHSSASKTKALLNPDGGYEVVGDVKFLKIDTNSDLTVVGAVIDCDVDTETGANIRQWHHTLDTQQLLDADEAGDDDLRLEKPNLDNANELQTG